jgi:hypothetical protein
VSLGVPQIFLGNVGRRLNEDRFSKHYCNKCGKKYPEYKCRIGNKVIVLYSKFNI